MKCCFKELSRARILVFSYIYTFLFMFASFGYTVFGMWTQMSPDGQVRNLTFFTLGFIVPMMLMRLILYCILVVGVHTHSFELLEIYIVGIVVLTVLGIVMTMYIIIFKGGWEAIIDLVLYILEGYMAVCIYHYMKEIKPTEGPLIIYSAQKIDSL